MNKSGCSAVAAFALAMLGLGTAAADAIHDWNAIMLATTSTQNPLAATRFGTIMHVAMFEAVSAVTRKYEPYLGTVTAPAGASPDAAAVAAAHRVLSTYFPANAPTLDAARAASLAAIPDGQAENDGVAVGEAAAAAMIADRANDGSSPPQFYLPVTANPGEWLPTPGCPPAGGVTLQWGKVKPFAIGSGDQFRAAPPPALSSMEYTKAFNEVKTVGELNSAARPQDRTTVARYYAVALPVQVFSQVISQAGTEEGWSLSRNARAFALLTMSINDALITTFDTKYHYVFWRPITAIHGADTDANPLTDRDAAWVPLITTPCHPSYISAHASASAAGRRIAERLFGGEGVRSIVLTHPAVPGVTLSYGQLSAITDDIDDARVYGGIHFRFDQKAGARQGKRVADYVFKTQLRRRTPPHRHLDDVDDNAITTNLIDDSDPEGNESFRLSLSSPAGGAVLAASAATTTIGNENGPGELVIPFATDSRSGTEGQSNIRVHVFRLNGSQGKVSVSYDVEGGTATPGEDFVTSGTLTWADGETGSKFIRVDYLEDAAAEGQESFHFELIRPTGGATIRRSGGRQVMIIKDNDEGFGFRDATVSVNEGGFLQIEVARSDASNRAASIDYSTANGTAVAGSDYSAASGTLTWAAGDASFKTFEMRITDDQDDENDEGFTVSLSNPTGGLALAPNSTASVTIVDNDTDGGGGGGGGGGTTSLELLALLGLLNLFAPRVWNRQTAGA